MLKTGARIIGGAVVSGTGSSPARLRVAQERRVGYGPLGVVRSFSWLDAGSLWRMEKGRFHPFPDHFPSMKFPFVLAILAASLLRSVADHLSPAALAGAVLELQIPLHKEALRRVS